MAQNYIITDILKFVSFCGIEILTLLIKTFESLAVKVELSYIAGARVALDGDTFVYCSYHLISRSVSIIT